ncbi:tRNA wybutosine-synthesizing protein 3 homolog [Xenentodon cancila]
MQTRLSARSCGSSSGRTPSALSPSMDPATEKTFSQWKKQALTRLDLSKKGSVDEDVALLVERINRTEQFFTTSSCSGRIVLIDGGHGLPVDWTDRQLAQVSEEAFSLTYVRDAGRASMLVQTSPRVKERTIIKNFKDRGSTLVQKVSGRPRKSSKRQDRLLKRIQPRGRSATSAELRNGSRQVQKQNCVWLLVSHQKCSVDDLVSGLRRSTGDAVFKFEPLVLHVQCRRLEDAQLMHSVAINSGFRNSGLTVGKTGKIITAVRSTHGLEVPLCREGKLLVEHEYLLFLTQIANQKMEENLRRIQRFYENLQSALSAETVHASEPPTSQEPEPTRQEMETSPEDKNKEKNITHVYKCRRRRERQTDCNRGDGSSCEMEMDNCLDLFT